MSVRPKTSEYNSWVTMRQRCNNQNDKKYRIYGARGIKVCERWDSFELFLADVGSRPSKNHSIDRFPNNNGNYEPGNVRWATPIEQGNNRSNNRHVRVNGQLVTLAQAERITGIPHATILSRLNAGKSEDEALDPVLRVNQHA